MYIFGSLFAFCFTITVNSNEYVSFSPRDLIVEINDANSKEKLISHKALFLKLDL